MFQSLELDGYLYIGGIGVKIYLFFLRSETARKQVTKIVHLKIQILLAVCLHIEFTIPEVES